MNPLLSLFGKNDDNDGDAIESPLKALFGGWRSNSGAHKKNNRWGGNRWGNDEESDEGEEEEEESYQRRGSSHWGNKNKKNKSKRW